MDIPATHWQLKYMLISTEPMHFILILSTKAWMPGMGVGSAYDGRGVPTPPPTRRKRSKAWFLGHWN